LTKESTDFSVSNKAVTASKTQFLSNILNLQNKHSIREIPKIRKTQIGHRRKSQFIIRHPGIIQFEGAN